MTTKERNEVRKQLKEKFESQADSLLEWISKKDFKSIKDYLWRLIMNSNQYAYAKGYQTGRKAGFAEGIVHQLEKRKNE